uniref:Putative secretory peptide-39 n=1 Tax=Pleurobrachia bachei TaxID=34499 RepID=M4H2I4_PLEBA|nr:putative secretory peptide-39 [Pleurobrachia bachei]|eukprot:sb/3471837/
MRLIVIFYLSVAGLWLPATSTGSLQLYWTAVEGDVNIPWDLEETPLQIKTDSTLGSDERIWVSMYHKDSNTPIGVTMQFSSPMQYMIGYCTGSWTDLPVQPPVEVDKIWTITKTETALIITCNDVEVLNYLFVDSSRSECVPMWGGDVVEGIMFRSWDSASDFYKAGKGIVRITLLS